MISDYHLRNGETGLSVVGAARTTLRRDVPAVFLTGDTADQAHQAIDMASLARVRPLTKPLRGEELLETIQAELATRDAGYS